MVLVPSRNDWSVCIDKNNQVATINHHGNKPFPEKAEQNANRGNNTVMEVNTSETYSDINVVNY
ncbi:MAG: hypothetical protein AAFW70_15650 [Cyanobacteria bacterium J06635_10]